MAVGSLGQIAGAACVESTIGTPQDVDEVHRKMDFNYLNMSSSVFSRSWLEPTSHLNLLRSFDEN